MQEDMELVVIPPVIALKRVVLENIQRLVPRFVPIVQQENIMRLLAKQVPTYVNIVIQEDIQQLVPLAVQTAQQENGLNILAKQVPTRVRIVMLEDMEVVVIPAVIALEHVVLESIQLLAPLFVRIAQQENGINILAK